MANMRCLSSYSFIVSIYLILTLYTHYKLTLNKYIRAYGNIISQFFSEMSRSKKGTNI